MTQAGQRSAATTQCSVGWQLLILATFQTYVPVLVVWLFTNLELKACGRCTLALLLLHATYALLNHGQYIYNILPMILYICDIYIAYIYIYYYNIYIYIYIYVYSNDNSTIHHNSNIYLQGIMSVPLNGDFCNFNIVSDFLKPYPPPPKAAKALLTSASTSCWVSTG